MSIIELVFLAISLSMDAFAVSVCKGLAMKSIGVKECSIVGAWFGIFQGVMPFIGYHIGKAFSKYIEKIDHYATFFLLAIVGVVMIRESFSREENSSDSSLRFKVMITMAIATSIDAMAIGISYGIIKSELNICFASIFIGFVTFFFCTFGVKIGSIFGVKYKSKAELVGGIILIILGIKALLEHLNVF